MKKNNKIGYRFNFKMKKSLMEIFDEASRKEPHELSLSGMELDSIPKELLKASYIRVLHLQINKIKKIENLEKLIQLKRIFLHSNQITVIENLKELVNLSRLYLSGNEIEIVTKNIFPPNLLRIDLSNNKIKKIQSGAFPPNLEELDLRDNELKSFPKSLQNLMLPIYWEKPMDGKKGLYLAGNNFKQSVITDLKSKKSDVEKKINANESRLNYKIKGEAKSLASFKKSNFDSNGAEVIDTEFEKKISIYLSYAWSHDENKNTNAEQVVKEVYDSLKSDEFNVVLDKVDLAYGSLISNFMKNIGKSSLIIIFISDRYLKSSYCMFELQEIARNCKWEQGEFSNKVLPIPIDKIELSRMNVFNSYQKYWEEEEKKLAQSFRNKKRKHPEIHFKKYQSIKNINQYLGKLLEWLSDMNFATLENLKKDNFNLLKKTIDKRIKKIQ